VTNNSVFLNGRESIQEQAGLPYRRNHKFFNMRLMFGASVEAPGITPERLEVLEEIPTPTAWYFP
jgi:hypothetical protein